MHPLECKNRLALVDFVSTSCYNNYFNRFWAIILLSCSCDYSMLLLAESGLLVSPHYAWARASSLVVHLSLFLAITTH